MDYFKLIRTWFDFAFENPEKVKPNHIALYIFCVEHCNRLGWKEKFGLPTEMAKDAIGIKSYNTYIKTFNDLVDFGFIKIIERSKNQYSSNIIALSYFDKALDKALDKASIKHMTKHSESIYQSTVQSIDSIIKHITNIPIYQYTNIQINTILDYFSQNNFKDNDIDFVKIFNELTGKKIKVFDNKAKKQLNARLREGFSIDDIKTAIINCKNDKYHIENPKYLTPEFITRSDKLQKYLNNTEENKKVNEKKIYPSSEKNTMTPEERAYYERK